MDPNHDDKHPKTEPPIDLDSAIDELEGLLNSHDEDAWPQDDEEHIPVLVDVVETREIEPHGFELTAASADEPAAEPAVENPGMEGEPMLPFEFIDDITPAPTPTTETAEAMPESDLEPEPRPGSLSVPVSGTMDTESILASEPETIEPAMPTRGATNGSQVSSGELTPQLLDQLETIIDQELQRVTTAAKESILTTLRAHLDQSGQAELDISMDASESEHFPAAAPDTGSESGPEEDNPPLRPFDPFIDPD